jgi:diguanylate cyclase (GGDEF)-like protein
MARDRELDELRSHIARLKDEARKNEETWKRSQQREMVLLDAKDLLTLLIQLTDGLRKSYRLQAASVALADPHHEIRHLLSERGSEPTELARVLFVDAIGEIVPQLRAQKRPWLGAFIAADHQRLFGRTFSLASVALLPLVRHARVVGSLHFGSTEASRFTKEHATDFLVHLGVIAAFCLENAVNQAKLVRAGSTDLLTGWHNRRYLETRLLEELARSRREQTTLICLMIDIDHFKRVNDGFGHAIGDQVLREVARRIGGQVRNSDVSARYGGEEFVILLPHTELDSGRLLAERICKAVSAEPFGKDVLDAPLPITVSIGVAEYLPGTDSADLTIVGERLISDADAAMYQAKAAGRDTVALAVDKTVSRERS